MKQFRIVHSESSLGWGGQEIRVFAELSWMRAHGHETMLVAPARSQIYRRGIEAGFTVVPLETRKWKFPVTVLRLASLFREKRIDIVNTHSSLDGWICGVAARAAHVPALIRSRHIEVQYKSRARPYWTFGRLPHHVLTTSRRIADGLIEAGVDPAKITNLPTGVDLARFDPATQGTLREELKLDPAVPLVGMISVLRSWKGHDDLLAAAKIVSASRPVHFIVAGDGPGRDTLREAVARLDLQSTVTLLGHREDVPNLLASVDLVVLPSTGHEGVPQIILQAQAMGKPVVGTRVGGIPEVVSDGETGLLVPPRDPDALAEAIGRMLAGPDRARAMGVAGRKRVVAQNSIDAMGEFLERLYQRLLA